MMGAEKLPGLCSTLQLFCSRAASCLATGPTHSLTGGLSCWLPIPGELTFLSPLAPTSLLADTPRTLKRKSSNTKRLSPAPQLGPSSDTHTYYSESVVRESYFGSPRAASLARSSILDDQLHSDPYWSECLEPLSWAFASSGYVGSQMLAPSPGFPNPAGPGAPCVQKPLEGQRCLSFQAPVGGEVAM